MNRLNFTLTYKEGCSGEQLDMFKAILLSAEYNLGRYTEMTFFTERRAAIDIENLTYGGKGLEELEKLRLEAAGCIKKVDKYAAKVKYINEIGSYIYKGLEKIAEYKVLKETAEEDWFVNTAGRMIKDRVSFTLIVSCLKAEPLRVYNLAKSLNRPFMLSAEEEELIKQKKKL
ncbi:MAG: hypothetical protein LUD77_00080 [Clostridiales bacterium]|nr:hypothetical protein [Clostridiales bacterium]